MTSLDRKRLSKTKWLSAPSGKRAATIIDTAGAVVAIMILAMFLVPALGKAAGSSKRGRCLSNLMRISAATAVYSAMDRENMALPVHRMQYSQCNSSFCDDPINVGAYEWGGKSGVGATDNLFFPGSINPDNSKYGTKAGFGPASRPLNSILYPQGFEDHGGLRPGFQWVDYDEDGAVLDTQLDLPLNRCPSDTGYTGIHCRDFAERGLTSYDHYGTSYHANKFNVASMEFSGARYSNSPYLHRLSELRNPSRTLAYQENCGRFAWAASEDPCDFISGVIGKAGGWHGKDWTFNAAFIDGHADAIYMRGYRPELVFPNDAGVQETFGCVIIRGEGWQIDTLPVPAVFTGTYHSGTGRPSYEGCLFWLAKSSQEVASTGVEWR